jgi:hypothetical protein
MGYYIFYTAKTASNNIHNNSAALKEVVLVIFKGTESELNL